MRLSETYAAAIEAVKTRGWTQAHETVEDPWGRNGSAPVCLEGAFMAVLGMEGSDDGDFLNCPVYRDMQDYLAWRHRLYYWNDHYERTEAEVIEALEGARDRALAREGRVIIEAEKAAGLGQLVAA